MTVSPEHGKRYNTRDGQVTEAVTESLRGGFCSTVAGCVRHWHKDGRICQIFENALDLMSEYIEPTAEPAWIEWHGGECPIKSDKTKFEAKLRFGSVISGDYANAWHIDGDGRDIIAYRITENHEPAEAAPIDMSQNRVAWWLLTDAEKAALREWDGESVKYFHQILQAWHKYDPSHGFRDAGIYRTVYKPVITETAHGVEIDGHVVRIHLTRRDGKPISGTVVV